MTNKRIVNRRMVNKGFGQSSSTGGGGGTATWYYSIGSDNYPNGEDTNSAFSLGSPITIGQSGNITKISVKYTNPYNGGNAKIALYNNNPATQFLLSAGGTIAVPQNVPGWYDITISPVAVTNGQVVNVWETTDTNLGTVGEASSGNLYYDFTSYGGFPGGSINTSNGGSPILAVRVYVE